jgi:Na+-transporting methylmalonyl-CoA/oxaloacetate decarboxylase gamma subunit
VQPTTDPLTIGIVLAVLGMGGTLLYLYLLSLVVSLMKRLFPLEREMAPAAPNTSSTTPPAVPPTPPAASAPPSPPPPNPPPNTSREGGAGNPSNG